MRDEGSWSMPQTSEWSSLWECLHDASIEGVRFDALARRLEIDLELGFPRPPIPAPERVRFRIEGVSHILVFVNRSWVGAPPKHSAEMDPAVWERLLREFQSKSHAATIGFEEFRQAVMAENLQIVSAQCAQDAAGFTLDLEGYGSSYPWLRLMVAGSNLEIESELGSLTLDALRSAGTAGWDHWSRSRPQPPGD